MNTSDGIIALLLSVTVLQTAVNVMFFVDYLRTHAAPSPERRKQLYRYAFNLALSHFRWSLDQVDPSKLSDQELVDERHQALADYMNQYFVLYRYHLKISVAGVAMVISQESMGPSIGDMLQDWFNSPRAWSGEEDDGDDGDDGDDDSAVVSLDDPTLTWKRLDI